MRVEGTATWRPTGETEESAKEAGLRDLSLKGFCFVADSLLEVETALCFELRLKGKQQPPLSGEAVAAWSSRDGERAEGFLVGAQFSQVDPAQLLRLVLAAYEDNPEIHGSLCAEAQFCSDAEKGRCPAYQQGKNCWEFGELECCRAPRDECCICPYAALAFLI